jgi:hypothetical protein
MKIPVHVPSQRRGMPLHLDVVAAPASTAHCPSIRRPPARAEGRDGIGALALATLDAPRHGVAAVSVYRH